MGSPHSDAGLCAPHRAPALLTPHVPHEQAGGLDDPASSPRPSLSGSPAGHPAGPPRTRTCRFPASGSSCCGFVSVRGMRIASHQPGDSRRPPIRARLRMVGEHDVSPIRSRAGPHATAPPFAPRGPLGRFPHFIARTAALRLLDAPTALVVSRTAVPAVRRRRDLPGSWATLAYVPWSETPVGRPRRGPGLCALRLDEAGVAFRVHERVGHHNVSLSGLCPMACTPAVYASRTPSRTPTQDSLPAGDLPLGRSGLSPAGCLPKFQLATLLPLRPGFSWRTVDSS